MITKTGAGTLNLSGPNSYNGLTSINAGVVNVLPGSNLGAQGNPSSSLAVNNNNTGPGTDVTLNLQTSIVTGRLNGTLATPASGTNRAIVNLVGPSTELNLTATGAAISGNFAGTIAGTGRVTSVRLSNFQSFSGNNTYTGTTSISGVLLINGITSGQGDYIVGISGGVQPGTLGGTGTIGLAPNAQVMVGGTLEPGPYRDLQTPGTLHVQASGTGGVVFNSSSFWADIAGGGLSDLLAIDGGSIDLRSTNDRLTLNSLAGAFDGSSYTIATFDQNLGGGTFDTVSGLPANYRIAYDATSIRLLAVPEPSTVVAGLFGIGLLLSARPARRPR
jgi:autotransporter-associated beta strand protein